MWKVWSFTKPGGIWKRGVSENLLGPSGSPKKWPILITEMVLAGITEKRPFLRFAENGPKKHSKKAKRLIFIGGKGLFLARKSVLSYGMGPRFLAKGRAYPSAWGHFGTFGSIVRLLVSELRSFSWGDPSDTPKSVPPPHCALCSQRAGWITKGVFGKNHTFLRVYHFGPFP